MITSLSRWLTKSRLRTALAMLFFVILFVVSSGLLLANAGIETLGGSSELVALTGMVTAVGSVIGTISTVLLAWRADRRTAKESELKLVQLQQQIKELELKLKGN